MSFDPVLLPRLLGVVSGSFAMYLLYRKRRDDPGAMALLLFLLSVTANGLVLLASEWMTSTPAQAFNRAWEGVYFLDGIALLAFFVHTFQVPGHRWLASPALVVAAWAVYDVLVYTVPQLRFGRLLGAPLFVVDTLADAAASAVVLGLVWRAWRASDPSHARLSMLLATGIASFFSGYYFGVAFQGASFYRGEDGLIVFQYVAITAAALAYAAALGLLLVMAVRAPRSKRATARFSAVVFVAFTLLLVVQARDTTADSARTAPRLAMDVAGDFFLYVLSPLLIAYAFLRDDLRGADGRARWTIRQSTVGGVLLFLFLVVSQVAEFTFSKVAGPYVGALALGALMFAMRPLQRVAERVAESAVPQAEPKDAEALYLDAVAYTLRDGRITAREEMHLARLADRLKIGAARALELRLAGRRDAPDKMGKASP